MRRFHLIMLPLLLSIVAGCAAPVRRAPAAAGPATGSVSRVETLAVGGRPVIGVAFGGGSARGLAHIGVIRWLEEHRIPIDVAAGTSMGALVGGAFATGLDADALQTLIESVDWDELFGASPFVYKNIRRKADARAYPSHIEFGFRRGLVAPTSLNDGERVEWLLARITAPYHGVEDFDALPTPFRAVAMDLVTASEVVLGRGSLADSLRASMSLPLIFPPMEVDGRILVDGGTLNNVPADVVRSMGAERVIAVNVGELGDADELDETLTGVAGATIDAMMRASTRRVIESADVRIDVPLEAYGSLDWRRSGDLVREGYEAAERMRDVLLPLAVSEEAFAAWQAERRGRQRTTTQPSALTIEGFGTSDEQQLGARLSHHVGVPLDVDALEADLAFVSGLDRYASVTWRMTTGPDGRPGLLIRGRARSYAPPFMMLGVNLENTTSSDFRITATARYLAYGVAASGSELRLDGTLGSNPGAGAELYQPIGSSRFFVAPQALVSTSTFNLIDDDRILARYGQVIMRAGGVAGVNIGRQSDLRLGLYVGRLSSDVEVGDPGIPEVTGREMLGDLSWRLDTQDSPVVPSSGTLASARLVHFFETPGVSIGDEVVVPDASLTQIQAAMNHFWSRGRLNRLFVSGAVGATFDGRPLPPNVFTLGSPLRLGAYRPGEIRGRHAYILSGGYLRQVSRLPDFIGGPIFVGGWIETGDAFDDWGDATMRVNGSVGLIFDTIIGPVMIAGSGGAGRWRTFIGVGRIFD